MVFSFQLQDSNVSTDSSQCNMWARHWSRREQNQLYNSTYPDLSDLDRHPLCIRKQQKTILFIAYYLINAFPSELLQLIS